MVIILASEVAPTPTCLADAGLAPVRGGDDDDADLSDANLEHILKEAAAGARGNGRSVGSHAPCSSMFDSEMMEQVMGIEKSFIKKYNLGTCC